LDTHASGLREHIGNQQSVVPASSRRQPDSMMHCIKPWIGAGITRLPDVTPIHIAAVRE